MLMGVTERLIQLKRIAVLTDLSSDTENMVGYAAALARWYGSRILLVHGAATSGLARREEAEAKLKSLADRLNLRDSTLRTIVCGGAIATILETVENYGPNLLVLATHGREGLRKWLLGSVAAEVFRKVRWPVLLLGPASGQAQAVPLKQFERVLFGTDLSSVSVSALQYAAGLSHDHEAQLTILYVDPGQGFSFDRALAEQRLRDWLEDHIDGLSITLVGVRCLVDFGKPEAKIIETAAKQNADLVVLGAHGLGSLSRSASHFLGGTAYEVSCSAKCPVLIVTQG